MLNIKKEKQGDLLFRVINDIMFTSKDLIRSKSRLQKVVIARMIFAFLARLRFDMSLKDIGKLINRDHSTVVNLHKKIYNECSYNTATYKLMLKIANKLTDE